MTREEKQILVLDRLAEELLKGFPGKVPEKGDFAPFGFGFEIVDSPNHGLMRIENRNGNARMLRLGVHRKGSDRLYSNYLKTGTNEELIAYLRDPANIPQWLETVAHLSDKVDSFF